MNISQLLANHARYQPTKIAVECGEENRLSYQGLDLLVRQVAARLRANGVGEGDVVALRLRDTPVHVAALFAVMRLGAISMPLDWRMVSAEVRRQIDRFQPKAVLDDTTSPLEGTIGLDGIEREQADDTPPAALNQAPMLYSLTSGTTGQPKAIIITHEQFYFRFASRAMEGINTQDSCVVVPLPLAYMAGREHSLAPLLIGGTLIMFPTMFEPQALVHAVNGGRGTRVTGLAVSPNMTRALLALKPPGKGLLLPKLRVYLSTTGKLQPEEREAIRTRLCPNLFDYYGSSGAAPIAIISNERDGRDPTVAGRIAMGMEVEIAGPDDRMLPTGEIGMVRLRGPMVTPGFVGQNLSEDEGIRDGWYYPGDIGSFDDRGLLHLHGRVADLIKRGGLMVYAQEVEQVLRQHPGITDAAVVGIPSPELGEEVAAFITVKGPVEPFAVIRHCRERLAAFKVPSRLAIVDALPRNTNGKVVKNELKQREVPRYEIPAGAEARPAAAVAAAAVTAPAGTDDPLAASILAIIRTALGNPDVGIDDDFFELGGDSLIAAAVMAEISEKHSVSLSVSTMLRTGTARKLAEAVTEIRTEKDLGSRPREPECLVTLQTAGTGTPLVIVHGLDGDVFYGRDIAAGMGSARPVYAFRGAGLAEGEDYVDGVSEMVSRYITELRKTHPEGPYVLLGYCGGGLAAFEMAQQLNRTGDVTALIMIDPIGGWRRAPWTVSSGPLLQFYRYVARLRYRSAQLALLVRPGGEGHRRRLMFKRTFSRALAHYQPEPFPLETLILYSRAYELEGMFDPRGGYQTKLPRGTFHQIGEIHEDIFKLNSLTIPMVFEFVNRVAPAPAAAPAPARSAGGG